MEYSIQKLDNSKVEIAVSLDKEEWQGYVKKAYEKTKHQFAIEGFRKGKVPYNVILKRYGEEIFYEDAMEIAIGERYEEIVTKEKLDVVSNPEVSLTSVDNDHLKFTATVTVYPEFEVGAYKDLEIKKVDAKEITDEDVQRVIDSDLNAAARFVDVTDRAAQDGDMVVLDYSGAVDGEKFEGGTAEKYSLTLGSNTFIPGFEAQVAGHKIGETFDVKVTFPADYHAENLKGKEAVFTCLIHEIKVKELPAADDEFAKDLGEFDTFEEYKNGIKERLKADEAQKAEAAENDALIEAVVKGTDLKVPDAMIEDEITRNVEDMKHNMAMYGLKFEDYLKYTGSTEEKIRADLKDRAENEVKTGMIMNAIITKEKLVPSADELKAELKKRAGAEDGEKEEDYMKNVNEYELNSLMQRKTFDKLIAFLRANNKIV